MSDDVKQHLIEGMRGQAIKLGAFWGGQWVLLNDENLTLIAERLLRTPGIAIVDVDQFRRQITEELNAKYRDDTITAADEFAAMKVNRLLESALAAAAQAQKEQLPALDANKVHEAITDELRYGL